MAEWHPLRSYDGENGNGMNDDEKFKSWNQLNQLAVDKGKSMNASSPAIMPTLDHSSMDDYQHVYEPSDDTFLLIDAIKYDLFSEYPLDLDLDDDEDNYNDNGNGNGSDNEEELINNAALVEFYRQQQLLQEEEMINHNNIDDDDNDDDEEEKRNAKILFRLEQLNKLERINDVVMELGTGSGIPITYLTKRLLIEKPKSLSSSLLKKTNTTTTNDDNDHNEDTSYSGTGISVIATDLNPFALQFAQRTAEENGIIATDNKNANKNTNTNDDNYNYNDNEKNNNIRRRRNNNYIQKIEFIECNLAQPLLNRLENKVDIIIFNPPYVPTDDNEIYGNDIEISWAGGINGRKIIDESLQQIATMLTKPYGICYMITVDDNLPHELSTKLHNEYQLKMIPLMRRRASNEYLTVQKITWL
jgi:methylase of polypeptide subunit release factors